MINPKKLPDFIEFLKESLDSNFKILKVTKGKHGVDLYYIDMPNKFYRIFVETNVDKYGVHLHIGFEREINNKWDIIPLTDDLGTKEILGLFGTIKKILLDLKFNSVYMETDNPKKLQLYHNMAVKLNRELKFKHLTRDDRSITIYNGEYIPNNKLKYKKI